MRYLSVCSGIEAATVAWHPLGWEPVAFSEIEAFPSRVLARHYPHVPNLGDMTRYEEWDVGPFGLIVGGTPCQSFSVAGLRQGLADPRGNLMLTYLAIAARHRPEWLVWENVPGVLSADDGRAFGTLIKGMEELGYHAAWRVLDAQYVRVDGYGRAVPQRRRRVFVVGHFGDWRRAAAVLFDAESVSGNTPPRREAGKGTAGSLGFSVTGGVTQGYGAKLGTDESCHGSVVAQAFNWQSGGDARGLDPTDITSALTKEQTPAALIPYTLAIRGRNGAPDLEYPQDGTANAILTPNGGRAGIGVGAIAFDTTQITSASNFSNPKPGDACHPLSSGAHPPAIAWSIMPQNSGKDYKARRVEVAQPIMAGGPVGGNQGGDYIQKAWAVRRLTPRECERLQGFPDDFTNIPWRGKPEAPDGPRYKALGNSMAVNVMRWIGRRIEMVNNA